MDLPGRSGGHLRDVIGDGEQDRPGLIVNGRVDQPISTDGETSKGRRTQARWLMPPAPAAQLDLRRRRTWSLNSISGVLPPFAAMAWDGSARGLYAVTDFLGFRHLYSRSTDSWSALFTSARALAALAPVGLDLISIAVQSLLGWQVGLRTPFAHVSKVAAGARLHLAGGRLTSEEPDAIKTVIRPRADLDQVVRAAARLLCTYLTNYLDDHPDAVLFTGGQDSNPLGGNPAATSPGSFGHDTFRAG